MCLRRAPEKYIAGAALDRAALQDTQTYVTSNTMKDRNSLYHEPALILTFKKILPRIEVVEC
jgi:hypothetical protein